MGVKKDILKVFGANTIVLLVGVINGFFLPAFLGIDQYAFLKTYTLYAGFIGFLHFGFVDGIFIKYGGKSLTEINKNILKTEHKFLYLFQLLCTLTFIIFGIIAGDLIFILVGLSILPVNIQMFFLFFYQAIGEFNIYSKVKIAFPLIILFSNLSLIFLFKIDNYIHYVIVNIIGNLLVLIYLEYFFLKSLKNPQKISILKHKADIKKNFSIGIFILLGNLSYLLFFTMDRWFVKFLLSDEDFAYYAFAISMVQIVLILIKSVALTFYPYLSKTQNNENLLKLKKYLLIIAAYSSSCYFVLAYIVEHYISKYIPSLEVIAILFAGFPVLGVINALIINLFKVEKKEKQYFYVIFLNIIFAFAIKIIAVIINNNIQFIAISTLLGLYFLYFFASRIFKGLKTFFAEIIYLSIYLITFFVSVFIFNNLIGFISFLFIITILNFMVFRREFIKFMKHILNLNV